MRTTIVAIAAALLLATGHLYGQCAADNCTTQMANAAGATGDWSTVVTDLRAGQYVRFQVVAGVTYEWSTCGSVEPLFNAELTVKKALSGTYPCTAAATAVDADPALDVFTSVGHGLLNDTEGYFSAVTFPTNIEATEDYYVVNRTADTFQVSDTPGGAVIDVSSVGAGVVFNSATLNGTAVAYNDTDAGCENTAMSTVSWKADFTGAVAVLVTESTCATNNIPFSKVDLKWRVVCRDCANPAPAPLQNNPTTAWSTVATDLQGGQHVQFQLTAGTPYTWTTCLADPSDPLTPTFDTELSVYKDSATCSGAPLRMNGRAVAYDDDDDTCAHGMSTVSWTPESDVTVEVLVTEKDGVNTCLTNGESDSNVTLRWRTEGCRTCTTDPGAINADPTPNWTSVSSDIKGGEKPFLFHVVAGTQYEWRTNTNSPWVSFDTEISVIKKEGSAYPCAGGKVDGTIVAYNDNDANETDNRSRVSWFADFTGTVAVLVTKHACEINAPASSGIFLEWRTLPIVSLPCSQCSSNAPDAVVTPATLSESFVPVAYDLKAGDYVTFLVQPNNYYQWTTCGSADPTYGTTLTLFFNYGDTYTCTIPPLSTAGTLSGTPVAFNNDGAYENANPPAGDPPLPAQVLCDNGLSTMGWWADAALMGNTAHTVAVLVNESVCRAHDDTYPASGVTLSWRKTEPPDNCDNCAYQYPSTIQKDPKEKPEWSSVYQGVGKVENMKGGDYVLFEVEESYVYEWSTCATLQIGDYFDTQLTLRRGTCNGELLAYNDDNTDSASKCPSGSKFSTIVWYAPFTGTVAVLLSEFYCKTNYKAATILEWRRYSTTSACEACIEPGLSDKPAPATVGAVQQFAISDGEYAYVTGIKANATYEFTTCGTGGANFDTQLTLRGDKDDLSPDCSTTPLIAYNDNGEGGSYSAVVADPATDKFLLANNPFSNGMRGRFVGSLPSGINADTDYYIINRQINDFQVSLTYPGTPIPFSGTGADVHFYLPCGIKSKITWTAPSDFGGKTVLIAMNEFPCVKTGTKQSNLRITMVQEKRFTDDLDPKKNGETVVNDNQTGLFWHPTPIAALNWEQALNYCSGTAAGQLNNGAGWAGYTNWRLPTVNDLLSIVDFSMYRPATGMPVITKAAVPADTKQHWFWSATTYVFGDTETAGEAPTYRSAWIANLQDGRTYAEAKAPYTYEGNTVSPVNTPITLCVRDTTVIGIHKDFQKGTTGADPYLQNEPTPVTGWACDKAYHQDPANQGKPLPYLNGYIEIWTRSGDTAATPAPGTRRIWTSAVFPMDDPSLSPEAGNNCGFAPDPGKGYNFSYDLQPYAAAIHAALRADIVANGRRLVWPLRVIVYARPLDFPSSPAVALWQTNKDLYFFGDRLLCGDGYEQLGEECDDANSIQTDSCTYETVAGIDICHDAFCGDNHIWTSVENCDPERTCSAYNPNYPNYQFTCATGTQKSCSTLVNPPNPDVPCWVEGDCSWPCCGNNSKNACPTSCSKTLTCTSQKCWANPPTSSCNASASCSCSVPAGQTKCNCTLNYSCAAPATTDTCTPLGCNPSSSTCVPATKSDCIYGAGLTAPSKYCDCDNATCVASRTVGCTATESVNCEPTCSPAPCTATCNGGTKAISCNPPGDWINCTASCTCNASGADRPEECDGPSGGTGLDMQCHIYNPDYYDKMIDASCNLSCRTVGVNPPDVCDYCGDGRVQNPYLKGGIQGREQCDSHPTDPAAVTSRLCHNILHPTLSFYNSGTSADCTTCVPTPADLAAHCFWCGDGKYSAVYGESCDTALDNWLMGAKSVNCHTYNNDYYIKRWNGVALEDATLQCVSTCTQDYTHDGTAGGYDPAAWCDYCNDNRYTPGVETCDASAGAPYNMPPYNGKDCGDYPTNQTNPSAFPYWPTGFPAGYVNLASCLANCGGYDPIFCDYCGDGALQAQPAGPELCEVGGTTTCGAGYYATDFGGNPITTVCNTFKDDPTVYCKQWCKDAPTTTGCPSDKYCPRCGDGLYTATAEHCDTAKGGTSFGSATITCLTYWNNMGTVPLDDIPLNLGVLPKFHPYSETTVSCAASPDPCRSGYTQTNKINPVIPKCRYCGDGITQTDNGYEECDYKDMTTENYCKSLDDPVGPPPVIYHPLYTLGCSQTCSFSGVSSCPRCGDTTWTPTGPAPDYTNIPMEKCEWNFIDIAKSYGSSEAYCTDWCGDGTTAAKDPSATLKNCYDSPTPASGEPSRRTVQCNNVCSTYNQQAGSKCFGCGDGRNLAFRETDGLVLALNAEETTGYTVRDSSPSPLTGSFSQGFQLNQTGPASRGKAFRFDQTSNFQIPDPGAGSKLDLSGSMTIAFWFKQDAGTYVADLAYGNSRPMPILTKGSGIDMNYAVWREGGNSGSAQGNVSFIFSDNWRSNNANICGISAPDPTGAGNDWANWHHVAGVYDSAANVMRIYVDGQHAGTTPGTCPITPVNTVNNQPLTIGQVNGSEGYTDPYNNYGYLDDLRIYNRALSLAEVQLLYNRPAAQWEYCDDGDIENGDGCNNSCQIEPGYVCEGSPSVCTLQNPGTMCTVGAAQTFAAGANTTWTVPTTGTYRIDAYGARGGSGFTANYGYGARMRGDVYLTAGTQLKIMVGNVGGNGSQVGGGGGGSFVTTSSNSPLVVAGGGGGGGDGSPDYYYGNACAIAATRQPAVTGTSGMAGVDLYICSDAGLGGSGGGGGGWEQYDNITGGGGGGGLTGDGTAYNGAAYAGKAFVNGGAGGSAYYQSGYAGYSGAGGFGGGGGGGYQASYAGAGGGGGYSGGGGGSGYTKFGPGGGGGSFLAAGASDTISTPGTNNAAGSVSIQRVVPCCGNGALDGGEACDPAGNIGNPCDGCSDTCTTLTNSCGDGLVCGSGECEDNQPGHPATWRSNADADDGCFQDCKAGLRPVGVHRTATTTGGITGWSCDPDNWAGTVQVRIRFYYGNGNIDPNAATEYTVPQPLIIDANLLSSAQVKAACNGQGDFHDFAYSAAQVATIVDTMRNSAAPLMKPPYWARVFGIDADAPAAQKDRLLTNSPLRIPVCGDIPGDLDEGEECDQGQAGYGDSCDGCTDDCKIIPAYSCGDGVICTNHGVNEECDDGLVNNSYDKPCTEDCRINPCAYGTGWYFNVANDRCYAMTPGGSSQNFYGALNACTNATYRSNLVSLNNAAEESWLRTVFPAMASGYTVIGGSEVWDTYQRATTALGGTANTWVEEVWAYPVTNRVYFGSMSGRANNFNVGTYDGLDVRYTWRVPANGSYRVNLIPNSSFNAVLSVYNYQTFAWTHYNNVLSAGSGAAFMETTGDMPGLIAGHTYEFVVDSTAAGAYTYILEILQNNTQPTDGYTKWTDNSAFSYTNWLPGHPTFASDISRWTAANNITNTWNDGGLNAYQYLCEKPGYDVCGNGYKSATEGCDDGNTTPGDGCSAACAVETGSGWACSTTYMPSRCWKCGNGVREWYEQCDDGNTAAGDGCSASCTIESAAWHCNGNSPTVCRNCGNGIMEGNEFCDPGIIVTCASRSDLVPPQGGTVTGNIVCDGCTSLVTANNCFKTYTCSAGLPANACWYNCEAVAPFSTTYTYNQTWNGSAWVNADNYLFGFNASPAENSCQFKCRPNYTWNAGTSTCDQNQQRVSCGAKPRSDTYELWNDGESGANIGTYLQTWDGVSGTWQPVLSPHYDPAVGPCHFKCAAGAVWDAGLGQCRICGDNIKEGIEACDMSQFGTSTCQNTVTPPEGSATGGSLSCNLSCGLITTGCTKSWNCVNKPVGTVYYGGGETYSYGQGWNGSAWVNANNYLDGYAASPTVNSCQYTCAGAGYVYDGLACSKCGDGVPTGMEVCDDGDLRNDNACKNNCTWNTCRDGYVLTGTEACDDGNAVDTDYCRNNCSWNTCGDNSLKATPVNMTHLLPFDGNANDASGKGNNGTLLNGATYVAGGGRWGTHGLSLDGIDDRVSIPTTGMSNLQGTIDYWIKPNGWSGGAGGAANQHGSFQTIASWSNGARGQMMILDNYEGRFYFRIVDETAASVDVSFANNAYYTSGNWTRVTVTWSRITSRMKVYMNGGFVAETVWNQPIATPFESTAYIGIGHGNPQLGVIDHFRILNRALSDAEITNSMWESFDGTSAGVDFSHRANNGTLVNGPTVVAGKVGNALSFNGSNQYVTVPDDASQMRLGTAMTVETWVKIAANPGDWVRIVGKSDTDASCSNRNYGLWIASTGQILFQIGGSTGVWGNLMSVRTVTNNAWRHVAGTYDGANMRIYIDGVLEGQLAYTQTPITSAGPLTIGSAVGCHGYLNGQMDETRIYQRALTIAEIRNNFEYCDDGNGTNTDACTNSCTSAVCGDTIVKSTAPAESCDSGFLYNGGYGYCKTDCSAMGPRCGDGILTFTTANMVLRLNMDEGSGTTASDSAGTAQNGTITSPWWVAAGNPYSTKFNNALYFDGGARYVTMANHADLQLGAAQASFTVSAWVNFPAGAAGTRFPIITKGTGNTLNYALWLEPEIVPNPAGHVSFVFHPDPTGCGAHSNIAVTDGAWHHVVGVYDGANMYIYVDGVQRGTQTCALIPPSGDTNPLYIGYVLPGGYPYMSGYIDEVRIYKGKALSPAEILSDWDNRYIMEACDDAGCKADCSGPACTASTYTFTTVGSTTWTVPAGVAGTVTIKTWGARGANGSASFGGYAGANGGYATGTLAVTPGATQLQINVGGGGSGITGGWNGGGASYANGGGGGGATDVRVSPYAVGNRVIVAAGGGGGGCLASGYSYTGSAGGAGGGASGTTSAASSGGTSSGEGASGATGGGSTGCCTAGSVGGSSATGLGGAGAPNGCSGTYTGGGGGGGGGYAGGGGGGNCGGNVGGGGGSSYTGGVGGGSTTANTASPNTPNGRVEISTTCP